MTNFSINTKNLKGEINGVRYEIRLADKPFMVGYRVIHITLSKYVDMFDKFIMDNNVAVAYVDNYYEALRSALIEAEKEFNIELIKYK